MYLDTEHAICKCKNYRFINSIQIFYIVWEAVVAEWLRRLTRNQMGSARAGSNPAGCEFFLHKFRGMNLIES